MEPAAFLVGQAWIIVSYLYFMVRSEAVCRRQLSVARASRRR